MTRTLRILMEGLIDYAGLFPPAKLEMRPAVENYAKYVRSEERWMLGRFICPASRLEEFSAAAGMLMPGTLGTSGYREHADASAPWTVSVVVDTELDEALDAIDAFNERHSHEDRGRAQADSLELRAASPGFIDEAIEAIPESLMAYFEIPLEGDLRGFVTALAGEHAAAKIRCGGVEAGMTPPVEAVARFIDTCAFADVRFKATAGLHHPVRAVHPLTYDPEPERSTMHGFLNVFVGAALRHARAIDLEGLTSVLRDESDQSFELREDVVRWKEEEIDAAQFARARERFALAFGSCSFEEPIDDLKKLKLL